MTTIPQESVPQPDPAESPDVVPSLDPDQPAADPQTQPAPAPEAT